MELNRFAVSAKHQRSGAPGAARRLPQGFTKKSQNNPMQSRRLRLANLVCLASGHEKMVRRRAPGVTPKRYFFIFLRCDSTISFLL
jgi:hypothetical protein